MRRPYRSRSLLAAPGDHLGDWLSPLVDHELSASQEAEANAHLGRCSQCASELASIENVRRLVRRLQSVPLPPDATKNLGPAEPAHRWKAWAAAAAIAAMSVGASAGLGAATSTPTSGARRPSSPAFGPAPVARSAGIGSFNPIAIPMGFGP